MHETQVNNVDKLTQWDRVSYSPPRIVVRIIVSSVPSVCLSVSFVYPLAYLTNHTKFPVHRSYVTYDRGSVILWRQCYVLCTSGFVNDVVFSYNAVNISQIQSRHVCFGTGGEVCRLWLHLVDALFNFLITILSKLLTLDSAYSSDT